jgi:GNAT superfamily N-acetyltransferase
MQISNFSPDDIHPFLNLAKDEGWISTRRELGFLLERYPEGCLTCHQENRAVGFVTAVRYRDSGWIGNLLVENGYRGKGFGTELFKQAMFALKRSGVKTVWLTASKYGRPIYERNGFNLSDRVQRWERSGGETIQSTSIKRIEPDWQQIDFLGWGDDRNVLLSHSANSGWITGNENGFLVIQRIGKRDQIGPFGALNPGTAEQLLEKTEILGGNRLLDVPESNKAASKILASRGFSVSSVVELMYSGETPAYHPEHIFGLASMGSMG